MSTDPINPHKETDGDFIKAVGTKGFKNAFRTTTNPEHYDLSQIYTGGYLPMMEGLEKPSVNNINFANNILTASTASPTLASKPQQFLTIDGVDIPIADIVAKSAIPYSKNLKRRFVNAIQTDQVINTVFNITTFYIFNVGRKSAIRPIGDYRTKNIQELTQMLDKIISPEIQTDCINYLDNVDTQSKVWTDYAPLAFLHMLTFGTGGFFKELMNATDIQNEFLEIDIPLGTPCVLKTLHPFFFEKLYQNRKTFKPILLEYSDTNYTLIDDEIFNNPKASNEVVDQFKGWKQLVIRDPNKDYEKKNLLLPLNQMVIFKNNLSIAPNVEWFGTSKIFSILPITEINREIHYNILPSVNKVQSQGSGIISTKIRNEDKLNKLVSQLEEGTNYIVTNTEGLDYKEIRINVDLQGIASERFDNVRQILMGLNFPSPLINFESVTNRATMDSVLQFFQNTSLETLRDIVSTSMSNQWYIPLMIFFFNNVLGSTLDGQSKEIQKYKFVNLKLKVITEFEKIDFDLFSEKLKSLNNVTFLTDQEKREICGRDPFPIEDETVEPVQNMNNQLKEIDKIAKDATLTPEDKDAQIKEMKGQIAELSLKGKKVATKQEQKQKTSPRPVPK